MMSPNREIEEEEEALLRPGETGAAQKQGGASPRRKRKADLDDSEQAFFSLGHYSTLALFTIFAIVSIIIWSLPAPTFSAKLNLLQQSWHLNTVLDESAHLHEQINNLHKEKAALEQSLMKEDARAIELKKRLGSADSDTVSLRKQLKTDEQTLTGLRDSSKALEEQIDKEQGRRKALLHELQGVKHAELPLIQAMVRGVKEVTASGLVGAGVRLRSTEPGFMDIKVPEAKVLDSKTLDGKTSVGPLRARGSLVRGDEPSEGDRSIRPGGLGDEHEADEEVAELCNGRIRSQAEEMAQGQGWNGAFTEFTPLKYKKQVVNGLNYFVRLRVSSAELLDVRIYKPAVYAHEDPSVVAVKLGVRDSDDIEHFEQ